MLPKFTNILVPTDFSPASERVLAYARALAERFGASLHLLHVVEDPVMAAAWSEAYAFDVAGLQARFREEAERRLTEVAASLTGVTVTTDVLDGSPARTIAAAAGDKGMDLIVMGTHGRSGLSHLLLGSVAERVVRSAPCPVLTVREAVTPLAEAPRVIAEAEPISV
jgi:universal stress protein A